jgi:hypothetical protein
MARAQVADGGDALQVWRVAANILNKQLRAADKGWAFSLGLATPHCKNKLVMKDHKKAWTWMDSLDK